MEMDTQLNCQSRQTNTKLILVWKGAVPGGRGCPGLLERNIPEVLGWEHLQDTEHRAQEPGGLGGSWAPSPPATGEGGNLPFSGISAQALSFALSLRARSSGWPSGAEGPWHGPGEPKAGTATLCHPFPLTAPVPGQESPNRQRITSIPSQEIIESSRFL